MHGTLLKACRAHEAMGQSLPCPDGQIDASEQTKKHAPLCYSGEHAVDTWKGLMNFCFF